MAKLVWHLPDSERPLVADIADGFHQVASIADGQREFLHGVIEFSQTRTSTQMTITAEGLNTTAVQQNDDMRWITVWVAIVAVPTAVTGFFGQKIPYPVASIVIMTAIATGHFSPSNARTGSDPNPDEPAVDRGTPDQHSWRPPSQHGCRRRRCRGRWHGRRQSPG